MNHRFTALAASLLLAAVPMTALADDESPITWEVTAVSDYVFRGASQTDEKPTAQAGLTWTHDSGFYAGGWASGVDFGTSKPDFEVDAFVGYNVDLNDTINFDVALNRYNYPSAGDSNYNELITTTTINDYALTVAYTNDVWATDTDGWYFAVGHEWELPQEFTLAANVGYSTFEDKEVARNYADWSLGVSRAFGPATVGLTYHGTNGNGDYNFGELGDDRVVLSVSFGN